MCFFYPLVIELQWSLRFSFPLHLKCHPQSEDYAPRHNHQFLKHIEITSWKARAYGIFTRVGEVSEIERVSAVNE